MNTYFSTAAILLLLWIAISMHGISKAFTETYPTGKRKPLQIDIFGEVDVAEPIRVYVDR